MGQRNVSEQASMMGVSCLIIGVILILGGSIVMISDSSKMEREKDVAKYLTAEKNWNETYLPQFKNLDIQLIKNHSLYKENQNEIALKKQMLISLNQQLVNIKNQTKTPQQDIDGANSKINQINQRLNTLMVRDQNLKIPLNGESYEKDAHRLNQHDEFGDLPEYDPFSFINSEYPILQNWDVDEEKNNKDGGVVANEASSIQTRNEFEQIYNPHLVVDKSILNRRNTTVYIEITEKDKGNKFEIEIPGIQLYKIYTRKIISKKMQKLKKCEKSQGYMQERGICTQYYWAAEYCVQIAKDEMSGQWKLDEDRYHQKSFGCGFHNREKNSMFRFDSEINSVHIWQKMFKTRDDKNYDYLFPLKPQQCLFQIRHSGDPLLAALNGSKSKNELNFGHSSYEQLYLGLVGIAVSFILICYVCYRFRKITGGSSSMSDCIKECCQTESQKKKQSQDMEKLKRKNFYKEAYNLSDDDEEQAKKPKKQEKQKPKGKKGKKIIKNKFRNRLGSQQQVLKKRNFIEENKQDSDEEIDSEDENDVENRKQMLQQLSFSKHFNNNDIEFTKY